MSLLDKIANDERELVALMKKVGVPGKLLASIRRKCLLTPRRQTGRVDRRTNRHPRWKVARDHPDYAPEPEAHLVFLKLCLTLLRMTNAPAVDSELPETLSARYFNGAIPPEIVDPLTDEPLDYREMIKDVVTKPKHGYSKFHIGHQDPRFHPKHNAQNIRWQLKSSNDFQGTMDIRVARIAYRIDRLTRAPDGELASDIAAAFDNLCRDLGVRSRVRSV